MWLSNFKLRGRQTSTVRSLVSGGTRIIRSIERAANKNIQRAIQEMSLLDMKESNYSN